MIQFYPHIKKIVIFLCLSVAISACTYKDRVQPISLSEMTVVPLVEFSQVTCPSCIPS